jgi:hypothetical protein
MSVSANVITVEKGGPGAPDTRIFDLKSINQHIDESMAVLDPGKRVAFVAYADPTGIRGAIVGRIDSGIPGELKWTVYATKPYAGSFTYGAGVKWSV